MRGDKVAQAYLLNLCSLRVAKEQGPLTTGALEKEYLHLRREEGAYFTILHYSKNTRKTQVNFWFSATTLTRPSTVYKNRDGLSLEAEAPTTSTSSPPASHHTGLEGVQRTLNKVQCTREVSFWST